MVIFQCMGTLMVTYQCMGTTAFHRSGHHRLPHIPFPVRGSEAGDATGRGRSDRWFFRDPSRLPVGRSNWSSYIHTHTNTRTQVYTSELDTNVFVFTIWKDAYLKNGTFSFWFRYLIPISNLIIIIFTHPTTISSSFQFIIHGHFGRVLVGRLLSTQQAWSPFIRIKKIE